MNKINEIGDTPRGRGWLGAVQARAKNRMDRARLNAEIPRGERERESKKQEDIMKRAVDTAYKNSNTSDALTFRQMRAGANDFYRKNNYSRVPVDYEDTMWDESYNESKNMNKKLIRLTESDLHKIVKESVNRIINEIGDSPKGQFMLGRAYRRAEKRGDKNTAISASNKAWDRSEGGGRNYRNFENGIDFQDDMDADKVHKALHKFLNRSVKESVNKMLREDMQPNQEEIWNKIERAWNDARDNIWSNNTRRGFMDSLAWIMVDNNLTIDDLKEYGNVLQIIDVDYLSKELENCRKYMEWEKADDKRREAEAWAEDQMSDMGFGFEGD